MSDYDPYGSTRLPADVDRPDTLMFGLTARQILVVAVVGVGLWVVWMLLASPHVPLPVLAVITVPIAAAGLAVAVGRARRTPAGPVDRRRAAAPTTAPQTPRARRPARPGRPGPGMGPHHRQSPWWPGATGGAGVAADAGARHRPRRGD
ncbi:PrgI family mobile element protein [Fodinicola feengrottensis]|uniref:PrgI family mobile element protein n=1 Tax=Fodinicola feengrottensis TaxID=435914 RepID=UPI0013D351C9|nr:PrgI family protein [Fodinicola feengrottensis]